MAVEKLRDKQVILSHLRADLPLHLYQIGDLDDFFWPHTEWFTGEGDAIALLYTGMPIPCLLAFEREQKTPERSGLTQLLQELAPALPATLNAHVSPQVVDALGQHYRIVSEGVHKKMVIEASELSSNVNVSDCEFLGPTALAEIVTFYESAYADNWFDPRMLETGFYVGLRNQGQLCCVAGVHVYSAEYRVAALGNIATAHDQRRRGLARRCTAALCARLFESVDCVGLNVKASNASAVACYQSLGFRMAAEYCELALTRD